MNVKILSKKLIKPLNSPIPNPESFKLSFFDQIPAPMYMILILYYPVNSNKLQDHYINNKQRSNLLQKSLSKMLTLFYPFAGRYIKEKLAIDCNNEGVEYLEAEVNSSLSQILDGDSIEVLKPLAFCPFESEKSPLVTVQFNTFDCGGVAIGVSMSHRIADTFTMSIFMDAWAATSRGRIDLARRPNFPFSSLCPATDIAALNLVPPSAGENGGEEIPKIVTKRFTFDKAAISELKAEVIANAEGNSASDSSIKAQATRVKAIAAFLWKTLINVSSKASNSDQLRPSILGLTLNMRGRTNPPILVPENSCGNFISMAAAKFKPNAETKDVNLHSLVCEINDAITTKVKNIAEASTPKDFISMASNFFKEIGKELMSGSEICVISSLCGFPLYQDFGWGMATWTSIMPTPVDGTLLIRDNKDGDGIEVWVNLNETKMTIFQEDPDIVAFTASSPSKTNSKK